MSILTGIYPLKYGGGHRGVHVSDSLNDAIGGM